MCQAKDKGFNAQFIQFCRWMPQGAAQADALTLRNPGCALQDAPSWNFGLKSRKSSMGRSVPPWNIPFYQPRQDPWSQQHLWVQDTALGAEHSPPAGIANMSSSNAGSSALPRTLQHSLGMLRKAHFRLNLQREIWIL